MNINIPHTFHIPVMGLAYTIDSPIKVARFGIASVISIIEDNLIEKMRSYYYPQTGKPHIPISQKENDYRARRITDYLNLVNKIVQQQMEVLRKLPFEADSEITKYFEMLPENSFVKSTYNEMKSTSDPIKKESLANWLREHITAGSIDVNIMTKLDRNVTDPDGNCIEDGSDAVTALRGYAKSELTNSSIIFSAGMNPRLFNHLEKLNAFEANANGAFDKKIIIKVSDYRSALIQGKMLAKKGLWVSEFRIESGLNCGGHAFATDGFLLGPILEEFKTRKQELIESLYSLYQKALEERGKAKTQVIPSLRITVQGGIGTHEEDLFLREYYGVDGTGWGTPFLLVPEATAVDEYTLRLLSNAGINDVILSKNSPLGVRFHYLKGTSAEKEKFARIEKGMPGSPCTEKFLVSNTEFSSEPLCVASHSYQKQKIAQLKSSNLTRAVYQQQYQEVVDKECLCIGLSNAVIKKYNIKPFKKLEAVTICPGPNIAYFNQPVSLKKMVDHIYGRTNLLRATNRPHMFIKELTLYVEYLIDMISETKVDLEAKRVKYLQTYYSNIMDGIAYYKRLTETVNKEVNLIQENLLTGLLKAEKQLKNMYENTQAFSKSITL